MKRKLTEKVVYEPNDLVKIAVQNKPVEGGKYERKVTITVNLGFDDEKLTFNDDEDIAKFMETIDFQDEQTKLL